jgi:hypothetical protein
VEIVVGSADPLERTVDTPVTEIAAAGHYPQVTHPEALARLLVSCGDRVGAHGTAVGRRGDLTG